ncbi:tenascin-R-like isoform X1 [Amphiura filiformis]|uniref:tenascin-R-like isoform X1 n=1 Tax=Amphiura filiformis TaxID=82378 RepID=UPI003B21BBC5
MCDIDLPSPFIANVGGGSVLLIWDTPPPALVSNPPRNITHYAVTFTTQDGGSSQTVNVPAEAGTNYTITGLAPGTMYDVETRIVIETEGQGEPDLYDLGIPLQVFETLFAQTTAQSTTVATTCAPDEFFCPDGTCVSKVWACDGFDDCADGSDEDEAFCATCPFQFLCSNGLCTDTDNVCDGRNQCRDKSDETQICDVEIPSPSVANVGAVFVTLSWEEPPPALESNPPRNITHYAVTLTSQDDGHSQTVYVPAGTNYTITGLRPETMYDIETLVVIKTEGQGEPEPYDFGIPQVNFTTSIPRDCFDLVPYGDLYPSGIYTITPSGGLSFNVYCDIDGDGGWTVFQRRFDGSVDFYRNWTDYENGFGDVDGEYWAGLRLIHLLTSGNPSILRVELEAFDGDKAYAEYQSFSVGDSSSNYVLTIGSYSGDASDALGYSNNRAFSTYDRDHDSWRFNCAQERAGAWWYGHCTNANLNGRYLGPTGTNDHLGMYWYHWKVLQSLKSTTMKVRRVQ